MTRTTSNRTNSKARNALGMSAVVAVLLMSNAAFATPTHNSIETVCTNSPVTTHASGTIQAAALIREESAD